MSRPLHDPPDQLLTLLENPPAGCDRLGCSTCGGGGLFRFHESVQRAFPDRTELIRQLISLKTQVVPQKRWEEHATLRRLLNSLSEIERTSVFNGWLITANDEPWLALMALGWKGYKRDLSPEIIEQLILGAVPILLKRRVIREEFRRALGSIKNWPLQVIAAFDEDIRRDEELKRRDEEQAAERAEELRRIAHERHEYLKTLSTLSFLERVSVILSDSTISRKEREEWGLCDPGSLGSLHLSTVQQLIDRLEEGQFYPRDEALKALYERRHNIRRAAMEAIRSEYAHLTPDEQLQLLLRERSIPIEHYPQELAASAIDTYHALDAYDKQRFLSLVWNTRLRIWKKVGDKIKWQI